MGKIRQKIKNSENIVFKKIYFILKIVKNNSYFEFVEDVCKLGNDILSFNQMGDLHPDKNVYFMSFDNHTMGFFAYWKHGLIGLAFAEKYNLVPVIDWTKNSPYYEQGGVDGIYNPFEYYYEPVSEIKLEHINKCQNVARYDTLSIGSFADNLTYGKDLNLDVFARIVQKYYKIKQPLKGKLDSEINALLGGKKTLAVQIRGVEWGEVKGHPIPPSLEKYAEEIDKAIEQCGFEQIFLATDAEATVEYISNKYPGKVVVYNDVARAPKGSKTLAIFDSSLKRENNNYLLGYEVLRDMLTLTACQGLIASYSNISLAVDITKKSYDEKFEYKKIINAQISTTGVSVKKKVKQMENRRV